MRTSPKRSINDVINDGRLARQANIDKFKVSDKTKFILRKAGHLASEGKETRKGSIDKFIANANKSNQKPLELIDAKLNRRVSDINWKCLDVAVLCWLVSVITVAVFVAYLNGVFA